MYDTDPTFKPLAEDVELAPSHFITAYVVYGLNANALIFARKTKAVREAKPTDFGAEMFSWFKQQSRCVGHATKVLSFVGKCSVREQLLKHRKRTLFCQCMLYLTF